jgi:ferredoxin
VPYVITEPCIGVKDASCVDVCPVDCIHSSDEAPQYYINPNQCIDCAACELACPVSAIFFEDDIPAEWKTYISVNKDFFVNG